MTKQSMHSKTEQTAANGNADWLLFKNPKLASVPQAAAEPRHEGLDESSFALANSIGSEVIGPLCYGFSQWLVEQARTAGITHLYFLSRDGWLLKQAFDLLPDHVTAGLTSHYLYSSRRAVWFASLRETTGEAEFNEILAGAAPYIPVGDFLTRIFIDPQLCLSEIREAGFESENAIVETAREKQQLYALFQAIKPKIVANAAQERAVYLAYLKDSGVFDHKTVGLVDVGWTGSIIKYTRALVREVDDSIDLRGFFIGVGHQAHTKYGFAKGECLSGYLFDFDDRGYMDIRRGSFIIEKFFSPNEPSVIRMRKDGARFRPAYRLGKPESSPLSPTVQKSALQFVQEHSRSPAANEPFDVRCFLPQLKRLLSNPDPKTARILGEQSFSSDFGYQVQPKPIAKRERDSAGPRDPLLLFKQYRRARWKAGFIAMQPLPARIILLVIKKGRLDRAFDRVRLTIKNRR